MSASDPDRAHPSRRLRLVSAYLATTSTKRTLGSAEATERDRVRQRSRGPAPVPWRVRRGRLVEESQRCGLRCVEVHPRGRASTEVLVYLPGGAYINPAVVQHWDLVAALADVTGARVVTVLYPLAPEATATTVVPLLVALHAELCSQTGSPPAWAGDSAGGGLALATTAAVRDRGDALPRHLVLLAPWLDLELSDVGIGPVLEQDPTLDVVGLRYAGGLWAGERTLDDPLVSPLRADPRGLPPTTVVVGTRDIFLADCRRFVAASRAAAVDVQLIEGVGGFHVYPAATFLPEARAARRAVASRLAVPAP